LQHDAAVNRWVARVKRVVDVAGAGTLLAAAAPLFPLIAAAIYVDSPGPVLYRQRRAGRLLGTDGPHGFKFVEFDMLKFRTMRTDAEKLTGPKLAEENDPRITRVGAVLRRTRLDELPQLLNILRGEMSLVGPRPERPEILRDLALAIPFFEERARDVKPGLTGLAQVSLNYLGRPDPSSPLWQMIDTLTNPYEVDGTEGAAADDLRVKLLYDLAYIATLDDLAEYLRTEAMVILRTPYVMIAGKGR
jgi:lipopolysaccharide/colanic/teichoic acid biosynthesis glycosyltransferase